MVMLVNSEDFSLDVADRLFYQFFTVEGSFTVKNLFQIRRSIEDILKKETKNIVFDLEKCKEIDSSGIGLFTNLYKQLNVNGGALAVLNCPSKLHYVFRDTGLSNLFLFFNKLEDVDSHFE